jgi:hypothetical protein
MDIREKNCATMYSPSQFLKLHPLSLSHILFSFKSVSHKKVGDE